MAITQTQLRLIRSLDSQIARDTLAMLREHWTSAEISKYRNGIIPTAQLDKLRQIDRTRLRGSLDLMHNLAAASTAHGYFCADGKFRVSPKCGLDVKFDRYNYDFEKSPKSLNPDSCVLVWIDAPDCVYYAGDDVEAKYSEHFETIGRITRIKTIAIVS